MTVQKTCTKCRQSKELDLFPRYTLLSGTISYRSWCKDCTALWKKEHYKENKQEILGKQKVYAALNKDKISSRYKAYYKNNKNDLLEYQKSYYEEHHDEKLSYAKEYREKDDVKIKNSEYQKEYREDNIEILSQYMQEYQIKNKDVLNEKQRLKKKNDPIFKLRTLVSSYISGALKNVGTSKKGNSCMNYLSYTIQELKDHLESLFEPWMTWDNYGKYDKKTWVDGDATTWTWNIDHIIPRADLPYASMTEENFKKCWALENMRPYSAKQNMIDGTTRARHAKKASKGK